MKSMMPREGIEINLIAGTLTTEQPRQLQRNEPNWFMITLIFMHLPQTSQTENYFVGRQATCPYVSHPLAGHHLFHAFVLFLQAYVRVYLIEDDHINQTIDNIM